MRNLFFAALVALGIVFPAAAHAGVFMCNATSSVVYVAYGYKHEGRWISKGWREFTPNQCQALILGVPQNRYFYYYAESKTGGSKWSGKGQDTAGFFCVNPTDKFNYWNDSTDCTGYNFSRLDLAGADQFTFSITGQGDPKSAALKCQSEISNGRDAFTNCWMRNVATEKQRAILNCWDKTDTYASFAICANKDNMTSAQIQIADCASKYNKDRVVVTFADCIANGNLSDENRRLMNCALRNDTTSDILSCAVVGGLSPEQRRIVGCVASNKKSYVDVGTCLAADQLTTEQRRLASCVMNNTTSYTRIGLCAAGTNLTPEQQVFADCAVSTGGQPYAFAGCVGTQLTLNELQKCMTQGIGGSGCFGDNNTAVKAVRNMFKDIKEGPGPSNDLLGRDGWVGRTARNVESDLHHGPGDNNDVVGKNGWLRKRLGF